MTESKPAGGIPATDAKYTPGLIVLALMLVRPYSKWLLLILSAMLLETAMALAAPWPLKVIIDNVIGGEPLPQWLVWVSKFGFSSGFQLAAVAAISLVIIAILGTVGAYLSSYYTESVAQYVANDLRQKMYHHLQRLSLSFYDSHQVAKILNTMTADVTTIQEFAAAALLKMFIDALTITGMICIMFYLQWDFALIAVGITPFLIFFVSRFKRRVKAATREVRKDQSEMAAVLQQGLESMRVVNAFGTQRLEERRLAEISQETVSAALRARRLKALLVPSISITVSICVAVVLWRGSALVLGGLLTVGSLTVFLAYLSKFFTPVQDLAKLTNNVAQATVALERIQLILTADDIIAEKQNAIQPSDIAGNIRFDHVSFSYTGNVQVLRDVNFNISAGERIGICGPTGSGKSTVASLIPRFYDVSGGCVQIDGKDVRDYTLEGLRNQIAFVLQDTVLFFGTIRENIAYGRPNATDEEVVEAARLSNALEFIEKLPDRFETMVGERGYTLSGGQRQRIGIARALVRNCPILILDEPTAALDAQSEKTVIDALENLMRGRTVIMIAHNLGTIRHADRILVMKEGKIEEEGTHSELLEKEGVYFRLYHTHTRDLKNIPFEQELNTDP